MFTEYRLKLGKLSREMFFESKAGKPIEPFSNAPAENFSESTKIEINDPRSSYDRRRNNFLQRMRPEPLPYNVKNPKVIRELTPEPK